MLGKLLDDFGVGSKNRFALQIAGRRGEFPMGIHRRHHFKAVTHADIVIFLAMPRSDMHAPRALILGYELAKNDLRVPLHPGMTANDVFKLGTGPGSCANLIILWLKS